MKLLHISVAILSLLLVFVSVVHANAPVAAQSKLSQAEEDRILDDLDGSLMQPVAEAPAAAVPALKKPEVYQALDLQNGEVIGTSHEQGTKQ